MLQILQVQSYCKWAGKDAWLATAGSGTAPNPELEIVHGINVWLSSWWKCLGLVCPCYVCICLFFKSNTHEKDIEYIEFLHRLLFCLHSYLQHNQRTSDVLTDLEQSSSEKSIFILEQSLPWECPYLELIFCFPYHSGSLKLCSTLRMRGGGEQDYLLQASYDWKKTTNRAKSNISRASSSEKHVQMPIQSHPHQYL